MYLFWLLCLILCYRYTLFIILYPIGVTVSIWDNHFMRTLTHIRGYVLVFQVGTTYKHISSSISSIIFSLASSFLSCLLCFGVGFLVFGLVLWVYASNVERVNIFSNAFHSTSFLLCSAEVRTFSDHGLHYYPSYHYRVNWHVHSEHYSR